MSASRVEFEPTDEECHALVERILASKEFRRASRLRDFLVYVVDRKLAGVPHEVTELLIGHRVFGRSATYNPGEDSIVRTEARILRQRLDLYFNGEGVNEPFLLEIPKGTYVPVLRPRLAAATQDMTQPTRRVWIWPALIACAIAVCLAVWHFISNRDGASTRSLKLHEYPSGLVELESSDSRLVTGFRNAKRLALGYVYTGDPVGDWYDSTAGNRYAFCMRDVSHQSVGASFLGLARHTKNMLRRFAASVAATRGWCGFWEINKDGFPAPIDYKNDEEFWYCLPANFDAMQASFAQFLWTGDESYFDSVFSNFYDTTVTSYVETWDKDHDGIMESPPQAGRRGIPSYHQEAPRALIGADLVAAQYEGYLAYSAIQQRKGTPGSLSQELAARYLAKAQELKARFNTQWWNQLETRFYLAMLSDRRFHSGYIAVVNSYMLRSGITADGLKTDSALDLLEKNRPEYMQTLSYAPEILFRYGRNESAYRVLLEILDSNFRGRGMPEISFAAVGAVGAGLMGISPDARSGVLATLPCLPKDLAWVKMTRIPVLRNEVDVQHRGVTETEITNRTGERFQWKVTFPAPMDDPSPRIMVDGRVLPATIEQGINRQSMVSVTIPVHQGQTRRATCAASQAVKQLRVTQQ
jgi:hypothetical protein